jgi:hypothetical protein
VIHDPGRNRNENAVIANSRMALLFKMLLPGILGNTAGAKLQCGARQNNPLCFVRLGFG